MTIINNVGVSPIERGYTIHEDIVQMGLNELTSRPERSEYFLAGLRGGGASRLLTNREIEVRG